MSEPTRKTFVIKSGAPETTSPTNTTGEPEEPAIGRRKLFQINSVAPQYQLPHRRHISPNITDGLAADRDPKASKHFRLYFTRRSFQQVEQHVGWGRRTADNGVEQGGLLLGNVYLDSEQKLVFAIVHDGIAGLKARGSGGYLELTHETWAEMLAKVDDIIDAQPDSGLQIVGWYHTHPNGLDVFMSGTDRNTQRTFFPIEWQFAVVLNPHKRLWRVYQGAQSTQCEGFVLEERGKTRRSATAPELAWSSVAPPERLSAGESPVSLSGGGRASRWSVGSSRIVTFSLVVYSLLITVLASAFWINAHRSKRQKRAAEKSLRAFGALPWVSEVDRSSLAHLRNLIKGWRAESENKGEHDQRLLAEAERTLTDLLARQNAAFHPPTADPKANQTQSPMPVDLSVMELIPIDRKPAAASVVTPVPTPPYD